MKNQNQKAECPFCGGTGRYESPLIDMDKYLKSLPKMLQDRGLGRLADDIGIKIKKSTPKGKISLALDSTND